MTMRGSHWLFLLVGGQLLLSVKSSDCPRDGRPGVNGAPGRDGLPGPKGEKGEPGTGKDLIQACIIKCQSRKSTFTLPIMFFYVYVFFILPHNISDTVSKMQQMIISCNQVYL